MPTTEERPAATVDRPGWPAPLGVYFVLGGFLFASWAVRVPDAKAQVEASATHLGVALLMSAFGAAITMPLAGRISQRFGSERVAVAGAVGFCCLAVLPPLAHTVPALAASLFVFGVGFGTFEVALNSAASRAEELTGRPVMSPLHGLFSLGGLLGALFGAGVADRLGILAHLGLAAGAGLVLTVCFARAQWRWHRFTAASSATAKDGPAPRYRLSLAILLAGVIATCTAYGEGAVADWSALHLTSELHSSGGTAALAYAGFSVAIAGGRLVGAPVIARLGATGVLVGGGLVAAAGAVLAAAATSPAYAVGGFFLVGLGLANVFPLAISRAGALGGPRGVATASTLGYAGMLAGPPLIGLLADQIGLRLALGTIAVLAIAIAALAPIVTRQRATVALAAPVETRASER